ncbi:hypothetical protein PG997_006578 [Apiospora hydei]|uniref:Uncharacterized protein n=1 Tax=Apiospora hydei TaxID=1337664 RepID=A0ABR1WP37_9PEZI
MKRTPKPCHVLFAGDVDGILATARLGERNSPYQEMGMSTHMVERINHSVFKVIDRCRETGIINRSSPGSWVAVTGANATVCVNTITGLGRDKLA